MNCSPKFIEKKGEKIIYKVSDLRHLNDLVIGKINWPKKTPILWIKFDKSGENCYEFLCKNISKKYVVRIIYSSDKKKITLKADKTNSSIIKIREKIDFNLLKFLYLKTQAECFIAPWASELDYKYIEEVAAFIKEDLPCSKSICFVKKEKVIGLLVLLNLNKKMSLIAWVWIDSRLTRQDRKMVHFKLLNWLKKQKSPEIKSVVHDFNVRSNLFFQKLGFIPECVAITKCG